MLATQGAKNQWPSRRRLGVGKIQVKDLHHVRVYYNDQMFGGHPNRGGIWNFGDGEIAVACLVKEVKYGEVEPHGYEIGRRSGVVLCRSFDNGETWLESEQKYIWHNDHSIEEILDWLKPVSENQREQIDMMKPDSIIHFMIGDYLRWPLGSSWVAAQQGAATPSAAERYQAGVRKRSPSFSWRSADRGRTWERRPTRIEGPSGVDPRDEDGGFLTANLGYVRFDNGVLGIVGSTVFYGQDIACFYVSYDNGVNWRFASEVARVSNAPNTDYRYSYLGVHRLPDRRLICSMHRMPENYPLVAFSDDDGMTWAEPKPIVSPATYSLPLTGPEPEQALADRDPSMGERGIQKQTWIGLSGAYRSPVTYVARDGRIIVLIARRGYPARGGRGIVGVMSKDLGQTWSEEFMIRGDAYTGDCGYPVITELENGRFFTAYYITSKEGDKPVRYSAAVRYVAGTFFSLE